MSNNYGNEITKTCYEKQEFDKIAKMAWEFYCVSRNADNNMFKNYAPDAWEEAEKFYKFVKKKEKENEKC